MISVRLRDALVHVDPIVVIERVEVPMVGADGVEELAADHIGPEPFLTSLRTVVEREIASREVDKAGHVLFRDAATEVLGQVMLRLRTAINDPAVDINLVTLELQGYYDETGTELLGSDGLRTYRTYIWFPSDLTAEIWNELARMVARGQGTNIYSDLLMDAWAAFRVRDFRMSVVFAAASCEILMNELIVQNLTKSGSLSRRDAEAIVTGFSKTQLEATTGRLLILGEDAESKTMTGKIKQTFTLRNSLVHAGERPRVTEADAQGAIASGRFLVSKLQQY